MPRENTARGAPLGSLHTVCDVRTPDTWVQFDQVVSAKLAAVVSPETFRLANTRLYQRSWRGEFAEKV
ncbi:hypothetical protein IscW_ISCW007717 [Ixodes scapularis]|uniref:Uncharacterized protein n=1 Tax=Ixodes scapularis TaxID=6945 RepID=B7PUR6_IXOSC|nr:hypothetical protein IscW_ISCW007717 [Ixodes scapularis]|eukprot:XP_002406645.1 hypothetical protein IscW_ISCW007717 [Ixodes scapularis]